MVKIQEAEGQFITEYEVCERGRAERALWTPALDRHIALFNHAPQLAVAPAASRPGAMSAQHRIAVSGTSSCHASRGRHARARRARPSAGAQAAKDASAHSETSSRTSAPVACSGGSGWGARQ